MRPGQFGRAAAIAEIIETLTNNGAPPAAALPCASFSPLAALAARARCGGHELKCRAGAGDAKLYYARKLLRIDQNECVHRTSIVLVDAERPRHSCRTDLTYGRGTRRKAKERLDVLIEHNGENAEIRRKSSLDPTGSLGVRAPLTLVCDLDRRPAGCCPVPDGSAR